LVVFVNDEYVAVLIRISAGDFGHSGR